MKRLAVLALVLAGCSAASMPPPAVTPTPFVPPAALPTLAPVGGSGLITFGSANALDDDTLAINPSRTSFPTSTKKIAWSAAFSEAAGATELTWILAKVGGGGSERIIWRQEVDVSNPTFDLFANTADLSLLVDRKQGTYVMRYLREADILAEGKFTLTK
jgi:hypothetical protein